MKSWLRRSKTGGSAAKGVPVASKATTKRGFTLVEMMVVAPIIILLIGAVIVTIVDLVGRSLSERGIASAALDIQDALDRIDIDTKMSGAFLARNNVVISSPQGYDNATQDFTSNLNGGNALILNSFATTSNISDPNRTLVYLANMPYACGSSSIAQNQVMTMNTVYFVKDSTLWRRTLAVAGYASKACAGVTAWQQPSCAPGTTGTLCLTNDQRLVSGVAATDFVVQYYSSPSTTTASAAAQSATESTRQSAMDLSATIQVTITARQTSAGRDLTRTGTIRVTRVGTLVKYVTPS
jgi:Tfp pilus assembly protein PilE